MRQWRGVASEQGRGRRASERGWYAMHATGVRRSGVAKDVVVQDICTTPASMLGIAEAREPINTRGDRGESAQALRKRF